MRSILCETRPILFCRIFAGGYPGRYVRLARRLSGKRRPCCAISSSSSRFTPNCTARQTRAAAHRCCRFVGRDHAVARSVSLTISGRAGTSFPDRARFMAYSARAMRGLIIDYARDRQAQKRGSGFEITSLSTDIVEGSPRTQNSPASAKRSTNWRQSSRHSAWSGRPEVLLRFFVRRRLPPCAACPNARCSETGEGAHLSAPDAQGRNTAGLRRSRLLSGSAVKKFDVRRS